MPYILDMATRDQTLQIAPADGYTINLKALKAMDKVYVSKSGQIDGMVMIDAAGSTTLKIASLTNSDYNLGITYSDASTESVTLRPLSAPAKPDLYVSSTAGEQPGSVSLSLRQSNDDSSALVGADNSLIALTGFAQSEDLSTGMSAADAILMAVVTWRIVFHNISTGVIFVKDIAAADLASANQTLTDANIVNYEELECSVIAINAMGASLSSDPFSALASDFPDVVGACTFPSQDGVASGKVKMIVPVPSDVSTFVGSSFLSNDPANDWITLTTGENTLKLHIKDAAGAARTISPAQPEESELLGASIEVEIDMALGEVQNFTASWENAVGISPESPASATIMCMHPSSEPAQALSYVSYSEGYAFQFGDANVNLGATKLTVSIDPIATIMSTGLRTDIEVSAASGLPIKAETFTQTMGSGAITSALPGENLELYAQSTSAPTATAAGSAGESVQLDIQVPPSFDSIDTTMYQGIHVSTGNTEVSGMFTPAGNQDGLSDILNGLDAYVTSEYSASGNDLTIKLLPEPVSVYAASKIATIYVLLDGSEIKEFADLDLSVSNSLALEGFFTAGEDYGHDGDARIEVRIKSRQQQLVSSDASILDLSSESFTQQDGANPGFSTMFGNGNLLKDQSAADSAYLSDPDSLDYVSPWRTSGAPSLAVLAIDSVHDNAAQLSVSITADNGGRQIKQTRAYAYQEDPGTSKEVYLGQITYGASSVSLQTIDAASVTGGVEAIKNGDNLVVYAVQTNVSSDDKWSDETKSNLVVPYGVSSFGNVTLSGKTLSVTHTANGRFMTDFWALGLDSHVDPNDGDLLKHNTYSPSAAAGSRPRSENTIIQALSFTFECDGDLLKYFVSSTSELGTADHKTNITSN